MGYLVLARKWRPQVFDDLVGQDTTVKILKNSILESRTAHAYLFSGPRGVGKTSSARILAKALNCINGPTIEPCGTCDYCKGIMDGSSIDIMEIDGASNNSVDNIREIRERVRYAPSGAKFKVYIIDEAHMLSQSAFNALLKTLEEPPSHVIFVLATTSPNKIIPTVMSRCQHLTFKRITSDKLSQRLKMIAGIEGLSISDKAVQMISRTADGSMRDALTLLDQISSFTSDINESDVIDMLGISDMSSVISMTEALINGERGKIIEIINNLYEMGIDLKPFMRDLINFIRDLLVSLVTQEKDATLAMYESNADRVSHIFESTNEDTLTTFLNELINAEGIIRTAYSQRVALEMSLIKISYLNSIRPINDIIDEINQAITDKGKSIQNVSTSEKKDFESEHEIKSDEKTHKSESITEEDYCHLPETNFKSDSGDESEKDEKLWEETVKMIYSKNHILGCKLSDAKTSINRDTVNIVFYGGNAIHADSVESHRDMIEGILTELAGRTFKVNIETIPNESQNIDQIKKEVLSNPIIKDALDLFDGRVVDIRPIKKEQ